MIDDATMVHEFWFANAFVPSKQIQDNIIIGHEAFHYLRVKRKSENYELGLKVDMNKVFDRVECDFLEAVLKKMVFHNNWITLVMKCVSTVSFDETVKWET